MDADQIAEKIKSALIESEVRVVMTALAIPNPIAAAFMEPIVRTIVTIMVEKGEYALYVLYAAKMTKDQAKKMEEKVDQVDKAVSDEAKRKAQQDLIDAARDLIKWNR